jgi:hypothetical protein
MQTRISIKGYLAVIGILFLVGHAGLAQPTIRKAHGIEGFRELKWGSSIEQASKTYQDLGFERYEISNGKEEPSKVYVRGVEHGEIEDVVFDVVVKEATRIVDHSAVTVKYEGAGQNNEDVLILTIQEKSKR